MYHSDNYGNIQSHNSRTEVEVNEMEFSLRNLSVYFGTSPILLKHYENCFLRQRRILSVEVIPIMATLPQRAMSFKTA